MFFNQHEIDQRGRVGSRAACRSRRRRLLLA
jgi:hypothetical protein